MSFTFDVPDTDQVYVSGLPESTTEEDLAAHFGSIGVLKEDKKRGKPKIWLYRDKLTGALKGDGTVSYVDPYSAKSAVEWFDGKDFKGAIIKVSLAESKGQEAYGVWRQGGEYPRPGGYGNNDRREYPPPMSGNQSGPPPPVQLPAPNLGPPPQHQPLPPPAVPQHAHLPQPSDGGHHQVSGQPQQGQGPPQGFGQIPGPPPHDQGAQDFGDYGQASLGYLQQTSTLGYDPSGDEIPGPPGAGRGGPPPPKELREGDWLCTGCGNTNFAFRGKCNRCQTQKPGGAGGGRGRGRGREMAGAEGPDGGRGRVQAARQGPPGLFTEGDWTCTSCGNTNWARRQTCNLCNGPKPGTVDQNREGVGGGFKELDEAELEEAKRRRQQNEDRDMYDEFGRLKKKYRLGDRKAREEAALARLRGDPVPGDDAARARSRSPSRHRSSKDVAQDKDRKREREREREPDRDRARGRERRR